MKKEQPKALQVVQEAIKQKYMELLRKGETAKSLEKDYRLQMPRGLIQRAMRESEITVKHPKTNEIITIGSLDGRKFFGLFVVEGPKIEIIEAPKE